MISLIPYIRETFRCRLYLKMLVESDKLKQNYQEHKNEIHPRLIAIMGERLSVYCKSLDPRTPMERPALATRAQYIRRAARQVDGHTTQGSKQISQGGTTEVRLVRRGLLDQQIGRSWKMEFVMLSLGLICSLSRVKCLRPSITDWQRSISGLTCRVSKPKSGAARHITHFLVVPPLIFFPFFGGGVVGTVYWPTHVLCMRSYRHSGVRQHWATCLK